MKIAFIENPNGMYDLVMDEVLEDADWHKVLMTIFRECSRY